MPKKPVGEQEATAEEFLRFLKKERLEEQPKSVLLKVAIELDPEVVAESFQEGWTKKDIIEVIEKHIRSAVGNRGIDNWQYIQDVVIVGVEGE